MGTLRKLGQLFGFIKKDKARTDKIANQEKQSVAQMVAEMPKPAYKKRRYKKAEGAYVGIVGYKFIFKHGRKIKQLDTRPVLYQPGKAPIILSAIGRRMYRHKLGKHFTGTI